MKAGGAVELAAPKCSVRKADVGNPLAVAGKVQVAGRDPTKVGDKVAGLGIVAHQFGSLLRAGHKQFSSVFADDGAAKLHRAGSELNGLARDLPPPTGVVGRDPDVAVAVANAAKNEISTVPAPAKSAGGLFQPGRTACMLLPLERASQISAVLLMPLDTVDRMRLPSGEKVRLWRKSGAVATLRGLAPS